MDTARKAKLGERWVCFSCAAKFYDLNKPEPLCPKCGTNQQESPVFKQKAKRPRKVAKKAPPPPPVPVVEEAAEEDEDVGSDSDSDDDDELDLDELDMNDEEDDLSAVEIDED